MEELFYAFLNNSVNKRGSMFGCGYANGYVAVPPSFRYHGKGYDDVEGVDIHGGLTFAESAQKVKERWGEDVECIGFESLAEIPDNYWVFGFDTMHYDDGPHHDREWCINETKSLMKQLMDLR